MQDDHASAALNEAVATMNAVYDRCVWSRAMTHEDLLPYLIEESYEVVDAVETGAPREDLVEELGDVLWQVLFHSAVSSEFSFADVAQTLTEKMTRRHPHVFGDDTAETPERVLELWNAAKAAEKKERRSPVDGIPQGMPALARAQKIVQRIEGTPVAIPRVPTDIESEEQLGEVLLALVAHAQRGGWDAERALRGSMRALEDRVRSATSAEEHG